MAVLHEPFARALPGFDLFLPRLLEGEALGTLRIELLSLQGELLAMPSARAAKARWGEVSQTIQGLPEDPAWLAARITLLATIDELVALAKALESQGRGLWVLGI
jgi:hypothetical protein